MDGGGMLLGGEDRVMGKGAGFRRVAAAVLEPECAGGVFGGGGGHFVWLCGGCDCWCVFMVDGLWMWWWGKGRGLGIMYGIGGELWGEEALFGTRPLFSEKGCR